MIKLGVSVSRDIHYFMKLEDLSQISKYTGTGRKWIRQSSNHSLKTLKSRYTYTNDITRGLINEVGESRKTKESDHLSITDGCVRLMMCTIWIAFSVAEKDYDLW